MGFYETAAGFASSGALIVELFRFKDWNASGIDAGIAAISFMIAFCSIGHAISRNSGQRLHY